MSVDKIFWCFQSLANTAIEIPRQKYKSVKITLMLISCNDNERDLNETHHACEVKYQYFNKKFTRCIKCSISIFTILSWTPIFTTCTRYVNLTRSWSISTTVSWWPMTQSFEIEIWFWNFSTLIVFATQKHASATKIYKASFRQKSKVDNQSAKQQSRRKVILMVCAGS